MVPHTHTDSHSQARARSFPSRRTTVSRLKTRPVRSIVAGMAMLSLVGCATVPQPGAVVYCEIEKPISWSSTDDTRTIQEVKAHNAVYDAVCK